ncbi:hypothetical protein ACLF3G_27625 [Falsiroseomonas sp. HC035]|uniref:hypothetical protein n=1 Tax=Falsiroseomonas sp. HC035 TaxID=3390999 RepID=UPI003D31C045
MKRAVEVTIETRIVEAEAKLVRQRKIVADRVANQQHEAAAMGMRVLRIMEASLALLRDHQRIEEQRRGSRPAGPTPRPPLSVIRKAPPKAGPAHPR